MTESIKSEFGKEIGGLIFEIQRMSTEDGPGIRTTVFLKQCPLKCIWCHNPESILKIPQIEWFEHKCIGCKICIETCQQSALNFEESGLKINRDKCIGCGNCEKECPSTAIHLFGKHMSVEEVFEEINKDYVYYDKSNGGITVSGGEPTLQPDFIMELFKRCKQNNISTALDTCGYASKSLYKRILPYVDLVLLDLKEIDPNKHKEFTGVSNDLILRNARWIADYIQKHNKKLWIRTPIIPDYTATEENIKGLGEFIAKELNNIPERWDLLSFNNLCKDKYNRLDLDWPLKEVPLMRKEEIEKLYEVAVSTGVKDIVRWSGLTKKEP